ncbi:MAG TPA: stage V sporulation protein S, partial [Candidatus Aquilonibacter sp.]
MSDEAHGSSPGTLKVSAKSNPNAVAGALAAVLRERETAEIQAVGAGAINQAIKAVAIARSYLKDSDIDVICVPS